MDDADIINLFNNVAIIQFIAAGLTIITSLTSLCVLVVQFCHWRVEDEQRWDEERGIFNNDRVELKTKILLKVEEKGVIGRTQTMYSDVIPYSTPQRNFYATCVSPPLM